MSDEVDPGQHEEFNIHPTVHSFAEDAQQARDAAAQRMQRSVGPSPGFDPFGDPTTARQQGLDWLKPVTDLPSDIVKHPENIIGTGNLTGIFTAPGLTRSLISEGLEHIGLSPNFIKRFVGTERGAEGWWRQELSDDAARIIKMPPAPRAVSDQYNPAMVREGEKFHPNAPEETGNQWVSKAIPLPEVYDHPAFFQKYPEAQDIRIRMEPEEHSEREGHRAYLSGNEDNLIGISQGLTRDEFKASLTHELQHWVQRREGFPIDHPSYFTPEFTEEYNNMVKDWARKQGVPENELDDFARFSLYTSQSSEVEARNAAERMNMTPRERAKSLATDTEDIERRHQIISRYYADYERSQGTPAPFDTEQRLKKWDNPLANLSENDKQVMRDYLGKKSLAGMNRFGPLGPYKEHALTQKERNALRTKTSRGVPIVANPEPVEKVEPSKPKPFDPKYFQ